MKTSEEVRGKRLDRWLTETHPEHSRSFWQKEIKAGRVKVNKEMAPVHYFLKGGEEIQIITDTDTDTEKQKKLSPLEIIAEESEFLVINKPTGLLAHPTDHHQEPTLVDALVKYDPAIANVGPNRRRPGLVHRLDRLVSGVMVVAKTNPMFAHLKKQFADRQVKKEYIALVEESLPKDAGEITLAIGRSRRGGRMAARPSDASGATRRVVLDERMANKGSPTYVGKDREAKTSYEVIKRLPRATLVRVMPKTGRTHQIRAHFHALGHPIVGDPLYRTKAQRHKSTEAQSKMAPRLMLHAQKLSFTDLAGNFQTFEAPLPKEFQILFPISNSRE
ncbi:RluA family pseudouridine synthase [Candidatus Uhrbacteria bacterium]|nr:RluA family pseudouridine synthase [Candidatus Uhrbacteria bacterium]